MNANASDGALPRHRPADSINEAAAEWISRRDHGTTAEEETDFRAWLAADPRHARAIAALEPAWMRLSEARRTGRGREFRQRVEQAAARRMRLRLLAGFGGMAAAAVVALMVFVFQTPPFPNGEPPTIVVRDYRQILPDGSIVVLNAGTEIAVEFDTERRFVHLASGEALFHVAKDASRPFIVSAGSISVRAVGTAFAVRLDPAAVDVLVTQGRVSVTHLQPNRIGEGKHADEPAVESPVSATDIQPHTNSLPLREIFVDAGRRVVIPKDTDADDLPQAQEVSPAELSAALEWRNRRVEFNGTTLAEAIALFNSGNAMKLTVATPDVGALRITGVFWTNDSEAFAQAVETSLGIQAVRESDLRTVLQK